MAKKYLINGDVLNAEYEGSAQSQNHFFQTNYNFEMLITPERIVPQRSDASQNDHKRKGYPSKTSAAASLSLSLSPSPPEKLLLKITSNTSNMSNTLITNYNVIGGPSSKT